MTNQLPADDPTRTVAWADLASLAEDLRGTTIRDLVAAMPAPRAVWVMVPAGHITDSVVGELIGLLESGDCLIDGGNSYYRDDIRRSEACAAGRAGVGHAAGARPARVAHRVRGDRARPSGDDHRRPGRRHGPGLPAP